MKKEKERKEKKTVSHHNYKSKYKNNAVFSSLFQLGERAQLSKIDKRLAGGGEIHSKSHPAASVSWIQQHTRNTVSRDSKAIINS